METEEENEEVPRGDIDMPGHHLYMIASFDGNCYLVNKESGFIYWAFPTDGFLRITERGEDTVDYADLKPGDLDSELYHYQSNRLIPQLIPFETEDSLEGYFNEHYKGGVGTTDVSMSERYYLINYQTGILIRSFYSYETAVQNNVFKNEDWLHHLIINRVDFYLHRSSPFWSLRFARIKTWFPDNCGEDRSRTQCFVYHAPNPDSYINACVGYKLNRFPNGCAINQLIMENDSLSLKRIELEKENEKLENDISELRALLSRNSRIKVDKFIKHGDNKSEFYNGEYDCTEALIEKAKRRSESDLRRIIDALYSSLYHPNICTFLGWQSDDKYDYFAYEKCPKTLRDYINEPKTNYVEMSEESMKIMSGLVCGISHLHRRKLAHTNLSLNNIWMSGDKSIKIGGVGNSKLLWKTKGKNEATNKVKNEVLRSNDLYEAGEILLVYMTKGKHTPRSGKTVFSEAQFKCLNIQGTNREVLDLLQKLYVVDPVPKPGSIPSEEELCNHVAFWSAPERLGFFRDLSNYLDETPHPRPMEHKRLRTAIKSLKVLPPGGDWSIVFKQGVVEAMKNVPARSGQPITGQPSTVIYMKVNYTYGSPISLIRFMRNGYIHIETFSKRLTVGTRTLADDLGRNASEFEHTFRTYFPDLFFKAYAEVEKHFVHLPPVLKKYYPHRNIV